MYVPTELEGTFKIKANSNESMVTSINNMLIQELNERKDLIKMGDGESSSGSDSAPSEDNLDVKELLKNLPVVDKTLKKKLKIENDKDIRKQT